MKARFWKSLKKLPQLKGLPHSLSGLTDFNCLGKQDIIWVGKRYQNTPREFSTNLLKYDRIEDVHS